MKDTSGRGAVRTVSDLVSQAAQERGEHPALIFGDTALTWTQLEQRVRSAAAGWRSLGLAEGERVALLLANGLDFPALYFGALRAGLVVVPANPGFTARELLHVLGDSGAAAVVGESAAVSVVEGIRGQLPNLRHLLAVGELPTAASDAVVDTNRGGADLAVLIYTSGTSGQPKGAMLSHRALLANLDQCAALTPAVLTTDDVVLLVLPFFHIFGLNAGLGMVARQQATAVIAARFDGPALLRLVAERGVTNVPGVPPMFLAWSRSPELATAFAGVRRMYSGADQLPVEVARTIAEATGVPVASGYGLTETSPVVTTTVGAAAQKFGSIGQAIPGVELRLLDLDTDRPIDLSDVGPHTEGFGSGLDTDLDVDTGDTSEPGEIVVRGQNLFSGYWPDGRGGPDPDGWWRTGDIAYADGDGDLYLIDRVAEMIIVNGFNVYPREVEDVLVSHPDIEDASVIGVPHASTGETVKAFVVVAAGGKLGADDVIDFCVVSMARFKCPTVVEFATDLPRSPAGKVRKSRLRAESTSNADQVADSAGSAAS